MARSILPGAMAGTMPGTETDRLVLFDTTLRDGEQSPGASMTSGEKLVVAWALSDLGVDVIEAGFPAASPDDFLAVEGISRQVGNREGAPIVCGLARATEADIRACWDALKAARRPRIHTFLGTSPLHRERKLRMTRADVLARVEDAVKTARRLCSDVQFSAEDAARTEPEFLVEVLATAIRAGATTLNIPDTVGYSVPEEYGTRIAYVLRETPGIGACTVSVHCHDDLGLAAANTLAGIKAGARQAEVTINGIGERAGNAALEEVVMALATRQDHFGVRTGVRTERLLEVSGLVSQMTGFPVPPNKAVVGENAFAHEAGIHQAAVLRDPATYEVMTPASVGAAGTRLVLGKHSGRHALETRLRELGFSLDAAAVERASILLKARADQRKRITDDDLRAIVAEVQGEAPAPRAVKVDDRRAPP